MCVFCNISDKKIGETSQFYLKYDQFPVSEGHILVISKKHKENYSKLSQLEKIDLTQAIDLATTIIESKYHIRDINIGINQGEISGQSIMHFHCHIIPRKIADVVNPKGGVRGVIPNKQNY